MAKQRQWNQVFLSRASLLAFVRVVSVIRGALWGAVNDIPFIDWPIRWRTVAETVVELDKRDVAEVVSGGSGGTRFALRTNAHLRRKRCAEDGGPGLVTE